MSLGGQEDSAAVIVYGPDGETYGSPAQAKAAGVSNPTMSPPAGIPMPSIPTQSSGGRNRYAEIMSQYQQAQPFSFSGYPSTYTGGYDTTPYQPYAAPATRYEEIMAQPAMGGGGSGNGRPIDYNPEWTALTDAEKAAYYAENPGWSKFTQLGQNLFGFTWPGALQKGVAPDFVARQKLIAQGINPDSGSGDPTAGRYMGYTDAYGSDPSASFGFVQAPGENRGGFVAVTPQQAAAAAAVAQAAAQVQAAAQAEANREPVRESPSGSGGGYSQRGGESVGGYSGAAESRAASGQFGMDPSNRNSGSTNYKGGPISMKNLLGPNPEGPDDGYASLKDGEYVINDKAVKKYGIELMQAINSGKISKGKLRGLLEM